MKRRYIIYLLICLVLITNTSSYAFWASSIIGDNENASLSIDIGTWNYAITLSKFTDFEDVSKGSYASGEITTNGETWLLDDALIGTLTSDLKNDSNTVRIRNGVAETTFATTNLESVSFYAGIFGSDSASTLFIELSTNQTTWLTYQSFTVTGSFVNYDIEFTENELDNLGLSSDDALYFRFRSNNSQRINVDDVSLNYGAFTLDEYVFVEDFESAYKQGYAIDIITINDLDWVFNDALIGSLSSDQKNGSRSIRLQNGYVETIFRVENMEEISFNFGNFSQNTPSANLTINISEDGVNWYTIDTLASTSSFEAYSIDITDTLLNTFGLSKMDGLYIRLLSNDSKRINIDDFSIVCLGESSFNVD